MAVVAGTSGEVAAGVVLTAAGDATSSCIAEVVRTMTPTAAFTPDSCSVPVAVLFAAEAGESPIAGVESESK
jgi:hypothetical protein